MTARMGNPALVVPNAIKPLLALGRAAAATGIPSATLELVNLRASQINGCSVCLHMHARDLRKAGESDERIDTVAGWRDAPYFTDAERAALALAEAVTRTADQSDPVPDAVYDEAAKHYNEEQLASLILAIATVNVWNRLNLATRQVAGTDWS
ncbi:carboxymuconolactone decarboxylase family protein [Streptomyces sp. NBC_01142]|uniref:carboxymuconolactone decarboxylase family protein n=1 Tax=Streptomyces sp. NBC_01142 TaxID=2975865 RepID=UPI00225470A6|nr:carboxymuconolactone decarboxylase family protein [Streptomyces sp. NBC_01142]MCX4820884.1 carboxymuconolactone decarboxylase family protein [Streptomyces sp. NBC_01142]